MQYNSVSNNIVYTPTQDFNGADSFTYSINVDERNLDVSETVEIQVNPINDPPILSGLVNEQGEPLSSVYSNSTLIFDDLKDFFNKLNNKENTNFAIKELIKLCSNKDKLIITDPDLLGEILLCFKLCKFITMLFLLLISG